MKLKTMMVVAAGFALAGAALASDTGDALLLFKESGSFWRTAPGSTLTVPVRYPEGSSSATLTVRGSTYLHVYGGITTNEFTFTLPTADGMEHEDVYELSLVFDNGAEMTAKIGLPYGLMAGAEGVTRCLVDKGRWRNTYGNGLLPIPFGTTSLSVDGSPVTDETAGYTGAQGWLALGPVNVGSSVTVDMVVDGVDNSRTLVGAIRGGFQFILR